MKRKTPAIIITVLGALFAFSGIQSVTGAIETNVEEYMKITVMIFGILLALYGICLIISEIPRFGWGVAAVFFIAFSIGQAVGGYYHRVVVGAIIAVVFVSLQIKAIKNK